VGTLCEFDIPSNYNPDADYINTKSIEAVIREFIAVNPDATIVIKSTVPGGCTMRTREALGIQILIFTPDFLREDLALHDSLHPSRIVVGERSKRAKIFATHLKTAANKKIFPSC
jgi:UDPglucose 6-dehydrogenase